MKKALIVGIGGQDGSYLAKSLLEKGYSVWGTSRDAGSSSFRNLRALGVLDRVEIATMTLNDFRSVLQVLRRVEPDELYNLAGQTSVGLSFKLPVETFESIAIGTLNLLEAVRFLGAPVRFCNAGSSECFGKTPTPATEETPFAPCSPYAVAKASAFWQVAAYREAYGLFACSALLFNHESPLRPPRFVTQKIIRTACRIAAGSGEMLELGNIGIRRDWGWAPDYVDAMWRMLQQDEAGDYVVATGHAYSLRDFVKFAFAHFGLDWREHTRIDRGLLRPTDIAVSCGDPTKARLKLGWTASMDTPTVVERMVEAAMTAMRAPAAESGQSAE